MSDPDSIFAAWLDRLNLATSERGQLAELARDYCAGHHDSSFESARIHLSRIRDGLATPSLHLFLWLTSWMDNRTGKSSPAKHGRNA